MIQFHETTPLLRCGLHCRRTWSHCTTWNPTFQLTKFISHPHKSQLTERRAETALRHTEKMVVDMKGTPLSTAGGRPKLPRVHWKLKIYALALSPQKDWADFHTMITYSLVSRKLLLCRLRLSHLEHKRLQSAVLLLERSCSSSQAHIVLPAAFCHQPRTSSWFLIQNIWTFKHLIKSSCLSQWENT